LGFLRFFSNEGLRTSLCFYKRGASSLQLQMVVSDDRLPDQTFTRGKMNNAIKTPSSTDLQLRTKRYLQKKRSCDY